MQNRGWMVAALVALMWVGSATAHAQRPLVRAEQAWMRQPAQVGQPSAAYAVLVNDSGQDVTIVSARSESATSIELHEMAAHGHMMHMKPLPRIVVPAGGRLELKPGGVHLMLLGTARGLVPGVRVAILLQTAAGTVVPMQVDIRRLESQ